MFSSIRLIPGPEVTVIDFLARPGGSDDGRNRADLILHLKKGTADLRQPFGQSVGDLRGRSNRIACGELASCGDGSLCAGHIPHHEISSCLHPLPIHFFALPPRFFSRHDDRQIRTEDHAVFACSALIVLYHHRRPVALLIQCFGGLEDLFLTDIKAYPAFVNSLAQLAIDPQCGHLLLLSVSSEEEAKKISAFHWEGLSPPRAYLHRARP